ncbi:hypothetical protein [uncultured Brevundimonas sp.]|uniref:hypothetical protein n=1 Tax=uncultured Brevundimonas sp. TaxID=213418 RepID=UPI0025E66B1C|nr:hypothetical protein [uncultured Brevundimonas sp.]
MLVVENGVVRWSTDPLATVEQADAYAGQRLWADWSALLPEQKVAAILDASSFIRSSFRAPAVATDAIEAQISEAAIEAARLSLTSPLIGGHTAGQRAKTSVKAGSVAVEFEKVSTRDLRTARLSLVTALLRAAGVLGTGGGVNVALSKS